MKHITCILICLLAFGLIAAFGQQQDSSDLVNRRLHTGWEFRQSDKKQWYPACVPGTIHTDLMKNGLIDDPFYRLNEKKQQWIDKKDWVYKTTFTLSHELLQKKHIKLKFEGVDTYASVKLNGETILETNNMFRVWQIDVKAMLKSENELIVKFKSPTFIGLGKLRAHAYPLPASNDQSENGSMGNNRVSPFVRKAPYHFGWDWGPRLVTLGIWRPVLLQAWDVPAIEDVYVETVSIEDNIAYMRTLISLHEIASRDLKIDLYANKRQLLGATIEAGEKEKSFNFQIESPHLWYPNGFGSQYLYDIKVTVSKSKNLLDRWEDKIGIRTVKLVRKPDDAGHHFYFQVNGKPIFAKGANYIPNDVFLPRVSPEKYEHIIRSAADAYMNMIRVWGGGIYEKELFYDLCDQYGLMVWQDFMFACSMYPGSNSFLATVKAEAVNNVKRLRNHPCVSLWCGNNEIEVAWAPGRNDIGWGWKERYDKPTRNIIWQAYDTLFHSILPNVVSTYSNLDYWPSSPSTGTSEIAGHETSSGDMHYWGVWHGREPFSNFKKHIGRFMSEYGFQSFPGFQTVQAYTQPGDYDIESEVMMAHQRSGIGNLRIRSYMEDFYKIPTDFEDFLYKGQILQARGMKMAVDAHRSAMPFCMGTLYWQLNDCWPVASWSGIDYYGRWKAMHYTMKDAMKPVSVAVFEDKGNANVFLFSDKPEEQAIRIVAEVIDFEGMPDFRKNIKTNIGYLQSKKVFSKSIRKLVDSAEKRDHLLVVTAFSGDRLIDREIHYFEKPKNLELMPVSIDYQIETNKEHFIVWLTTDALAKNVWFYLVGEKDPFKRFSTNNIDLLPGQSYRITYPKIMKLYEFRDRFRMKNLYQTH